MRSLALVLVACSAPPPAATPDATADSSVDTGDCSAAGGPRLGDASAWTLFDTTAIGAAHFAGAVFDGRYLYFAPYASVDAPMFARYDTTASLTDTSAWQTFAAPSSSFYVGAVFDGRFVYYVPATTAPVARFDTQASFTDAAAWSGFSVDGSVFQGGAFDGRYLYLSPFTDPGGLGHGFATRYDTQATFTDAASWASFDPTRVDANAYSFIGAAFDGRYVYYAPAHDEAGFSDGVALRHDTQAEFASAWEAKELTAIDPRLAGMRSAVFDGRYLYFVPSHTTVDVGVVARFDTQASFADGWTVFDAATIDPLAVGFIGGVFDGRYVYFAPFRGGEGSTITRYDTQAAFDCAGAWSTYALPGAKGFFGAAFDGENVYFVPVTGGTVARFHAWDTPQAVTTDHGSTF